MNRPEFDDRGVAILVCGALVLVVLLIAWLVEQIG